MKTKLLCLVVVALALSTMVAHAQQRAFITTWQTEAANEEITIRLNKDFAYDFQYTWKDSVGSVIDSGTHVSVEGVEGNFTITLSNPGRYILEITGTYPHFFGYPKGKLMDVTQWGDIAWQSMRSSFSNWKGPFFSASDVPDLTRVTDMGRMFQGAGSFNGDLSTWDVGKVTDMGRMFQGAGSFNGDLSGWNTSGVTTMQNMFLGAGSFNGDVSSWKVDSVTNMQNMFRDAGSFEGGDLSGWNTSGVTTMQSMFNGAEKFNGDLSGWEVSKVENMEAMFSGAKEFQGGDLSGWNTSGVTTMESMFDGAGKFNGDLSTWDVESVKTMSFMFRNALNFNGNVSTWNTSGVTTMQSMFAGAGSFNRNLGTWDVGSVTTMFAMFRNASSFNGDVSGWNTSRVTTMQSMFAGTRFFNRNLGTWDVSNVATMESMFNGAEKFNGGGLSGWNTARVTDMANMFRNARFFNGDVSSWKVKKVEFMANMFDGSGLSRQNYDRLLIGWAAQTVQKEVRLGAKGVNFCNGEDARASLKKDRGWDIKDSGKQCPAGVGDTDIVIFTLSEQVGPAVINDVAHTVDIEVARGTNLAALAPAVTLSPGATSFPESGQLVDFTNPVTYTVKARDGTTTQEWTVTVRSSITQSLVGDEGFRTLSAPASGKIYGQLLAGFWTQGFAGASTPNGQPNLYRWDTATQDWTPFTDLAAESLPAGHGFLFYVFSDDNFDGAPEGFPKTLKLDNRVVTVNSGEITPVSGLADGAFFFAGNPYGYPIDWEALTRSGLSETVYVYDNAIKAFRSFNGVAGDSTFGGKIAPFQGFFVQGAGGDGSLTIEPADTVSAAPFFKEGAPARVLALQAEAGELIAEAWLSFQPGGEPGRDAHDGLALASLDTTFLRLATLLDSGQALAINALSPDMLEQGRELVFPLELSGRVEEETATLSFEGMEAFEGWEIRVVDTQTGVEHLVAASTGWQLQLEMEKAKAKVEGRLGSVMPAPIIAKASAARYRLVLEPPAVVGTEPGVSEVPERVELQQNYPNPFNPATVISYAVPQAGPVRLEVFDLVGRKVATLLERESQGPGRYEVRFDASALASGLYIYRLQVGSSVITKKLTLVK